MSPPSSAKCCLFHPFLTISFCPIKFSALQFLSRDSTVCLRCDCCIHLPLLSFDSRHAIPLGHVQVEVDYQGGGTYKRKYRVREIIPKGPFDITFKNEQVRISTCECS